MSKTTYQITGMHCASCASMIELDLEDAGIKARCSYSEAILEVDGEHDKQKVIETVEKSGYSIT